jgi:methionine salvage enolase-phosphatase E1
MYDYAWVSVDFFSSLLYGCQKTGPKTVSGKREKESYIRIAKDLDTESKYMLFFTDILEEAEAASSAGMTAMVLDRPGNKPQNEHAFPVLHGFYKFL